MMMVRADRYRWGVAALALLAADPARGQEPPPHEPIAPPSAEAAKPETPVDAGRSKREALFDIAVAAMAHGDLDLAERAFSEAGALPGDAVRAAVAFSFAERVRRLREQRLRAVANGPRPAASLRAAAPAYVPATERSQRTAFIGISSLLGATLYGWALPGALAMEPESARQFLGVYMLTAAGSFLIPYFGTRGQRVTPAQVDLSFYGGTRGAWHGVLVGAMFTGDVDPDRDFGTWSRSALIGSVAELTGGYLLAGYGKLNAGQTHTMAALGDLGLLWGIGAGYSLRFNRRETADQQARGMASATMTGAVLGLSGGYLLARRRDNTWGDAEVFRLSGLLGGLTGIGIADLFESDLGFDNRPVPLLAMAGSALGLFAGDRLVRQTELAVSESLLIDLGTFAGALGAAGLTYLLAPDNTDEFPGGPDEFQPPYVLAAAIGGATGFALSYWSLHDRSSARGPRRGLSGRSRPRSNVALLPVLAKTGERGAALVGRF
jgi:hypothetical protein